MIDEKLIREGEDESLDFAAPPVTCFVIGPIGDRHAPLGTPERQVYEESIRVWEEVIVPACEAFGINPLRADQIQASGEIPEQVFRRLRDDSLVIADLTGANPNVMYELGLRHTTGKLTIQIGERARLPFDISSIRTIQFKRTDAGLIDARKRLAQSISEGIKVGSNSVTASRVWAELAQVSDSAALMKDQEGADGDEPGFLEKWADLYEGLEGASASLGSITGVINEISQLTNNATRQIESINMTTRSPATVLEITNRLARDFESPAARLEALVEEHGRNIEKINPGMVHRLRQLQANPEMGAEAGEFVGEISEFLDAFKIAASSTESFRDSLMVSGESSRESRKINRRIAASLDRLLATRNRFQEWEALLPREERSSPI